MSREEFSRFWNYAMKAEIFNRIFNPNSHQIYQIDLYTLCRLHLPPLPPSFV